MLKLIISFNGSKRRKKNAINAINVINARTAINRYGTLTILELAYRVQVKKSS